MLLSAHAESSADAANRALAHFRQQQAPGDSRRLRPDSRPSGRLFSTYNVRDALLRLVAIAEDFSLARLLEVGESKLPEGDFARLLWEAELKRSADTWDQRNALWTRYLGVSFGAFERHEALTGFIDARNAISHGLGDLTRKQLRSRDTIVERLRKAGITVRGDSLAIGERHVEECAAVVRAYIVWLDGNHSTGKGVARTPASH
jgi:hypothetical protein